MVTLQLPISHLICTWAVVQKESSELYITRKPVVTGKKVILIVFLSIFYSSQFLSHQKISVTTKDTAELNVKHVKHNVITTKSIKMALANLARAGLCQNPRYHGYY